MAGRQLAFAAGLVPEWRAKDGAPMRGYAVYRSSTGKLFGWVAKTDDGRWEVCRVGFARRHGYFTTRRLAAHALWAEVTP